VKTTVVFCQFCGWARVYNETPTIADILEVMNKKCPDCGNFLFVKGQLKPEEVLNEEST